MTGATSIACRASRSTAMSRWPRELHHRAFHAFRRNRSMPSIFPDFTRDFGNRMSPIGIAEAPAQRTSPLGSTIVILPRSKRAQPAFARLLGADSRPSWKFSELFIYPPTRGSPCERDRPFATRPAATGARRRPGPAGPAFGRADFAGAAALRQWSKGRPARNDAAGGCKMNNLKIFTMAGLSAAQRRRTPAAPRSSGAG